VQAVDESGGDDGGGFGSNRGGRPVREVGSGSCVFPVPPGVSGNSVGSAGARLT
jgi:hypothetical protein